MDKNVDKRANSPWAIMDVLVRYRHEFEEMIEPEKPIGTNSNGLKIRYLCGCVGSSPSPGTNFLGTNQAPKQYQGLLERSSGSTAWATGADG